MSSDRKPEKDDALRRVLASGSSLAIGEVKHQLMKRDDMSCSWEQWATYLHALLDKGELSLDHEMKLVMESRFAGPE